MRSNDQRPRIARIKNVSLAFCHKDIDGTSEPMREREIKVKKLLTDAVSHACS